jgi:DsbC/DsbD-like thiol-disulfide interchange protein
MRALGFKLMTLLGLALALLGTPAHAQFPPDVVNNITASIVPEGRQVQAGQPVTLAIAMKPKPGWHGYWTNPGDAGLPMRVRWDLPAGVSAGGLRFPVPDRLVVAELMNYVYKGDYAHLVDLRIPKDAVPGTRLPIRVRLDYLACTDEICVPEAATIATELQVAAAASSENHAVIDRYRQSLPKPLGSAARFEFKDGKFRLAIPIPLRCR